jgi:hypothetical protein
MRLAFDQDRFSVHVQARHLFCDDVALQFCHSLLQFLLKICEGPRPTPPKSRA